MTPGYLHRRHQLSYRQIDMLLGTTNTHKYQEDVLKGMHMLREFLMICDMLSEKNIVFVPLKGPCLSQRIYGDNTVKICHDLDVFIHFRDFVPIYHLLSERGFLTEKPFDIKKIDLTWLFYHYKDMKFFHPVRKTVIELQWRLFTFDMFMKSDDESFVSKFTEQGTFEGRDIRQLRTEFELLYLVMHGTAHRWYRLKWLVDVHEYLKNVKFCQDEFYRLVKIFHAERMLGLYNIIAKKFISDPYYFNISVRVPKVLICSCINEIERKVEFSETFTGIVGRSLKKLRYQYMLIPHAGRRKVLIKKYFKRDLSSKRIKTLVQDKITGKDD